MGIDCAPERCFMHGVTAAPLSAVVRPPGRRDGRKHPGEERNGRAADWCGQDGRNPIREYLDRQLKLCGFESRPT